MRRFSQRNSLVTLSDINITPLLDLAFVLLIIFIITTPLLEQGLNLKLPQGGRADETAGYGAAPSRQNLNHQGLPHESYSSSDRYSRFDFRHHDLE